MAAVLECQIAKNQNGFIQETFWHKLDQFQPMSLEILSLCVYAFFSTSPWWPSWTVNLHKFEIVPWRKSKRLHKRNILVQRWITFIQWFLRYCHFRVCAIFSYSPWQPSWIVICINIKWFHSVTIVIESDQNTFMFSWDINIWAKLDL